LRGIKLKAKSTGTQRMASRLEEVYSERAYKDVEGDLGKISPLFKKKSWDPDDQSAVQTLKELKILQAAPGSVLPATGETDGSRKLEGPSRLDSPLSRPRRTRIRSVLSTTPRKNVDNTPAGKMAKLDKSLLKVASLADFDLEPLDVERSQVPGLTHDLSRVLFNPGVYQLQDPRSRVWNFDPYLGNIMPISEFNFGALNKYVTSSEDSLLRDVALKHKKRYIGSTSSLSSALAHFHFLLSAWRPLTLENLSRGFRDDGTSFTRIQRSPSAIFLRFKDSVYAVDADKEYDTSNILMNLGRSMEKLLTLEKDEFERYRRTHDSSRDAEMQSTEPEAYHYSGLGQFLLRSQLDAHDARLPGTGMFDLKTRAVAAVRMLVSNPQEGSGYQIKARYGTWESFEREYYDMMRSAFLKYSLQVRMGRMDGIFVAYHNIDHLFGFQYISLPEMDLALHGQTDRALGDSEFRLSVKLLTDIFDEATAKYPNQSLRFHFEAREATAASPPYMYIFAEPVTEEQIVAVQQSKKEEIEAIERRIFNPPRMTASHTCDEDINEGRVSDDLVDSGSISAQSAFNHSIASASTDVSTRSGRSTDSIRQSNPADVAFLESLMGVNLSDSLRNELKETPEIEVTEERLKPERKEESTLQPAEEQGKAKPILAWKLNIRNIVNELPVVRPLGLTIHDTWKVEYTLTQLQEAASQRNYTLCKNRRRAVLELPQDGDEAVSYYIRRLVEMSKDGAAWRRKQDELDSQRQRIVLYDDR